MFNFNQFNRERERQKTYLKEIKKIQIKFSQKCLKSMRHRKKKFQILLKFK